MACAQRVAISLFAFLPSLLLHNSAIADDTYALVSGTVADSSIISTNTAMSDSDNSSDEEIHRLIGLYRDARSARSLQESDALAKRIIDESIRSNGRSSKVTAEALTNLAILQTSNADNVSAVQNFSAAIDIVERLDSRLSSDLIIPLNGMGAAHLQAGHADRARDAWNRAVHISHVNFGPHNFEQIETLYSIGRMYRKSGMTKEVARVQKRIHYLQYRAAVSDSNGRWR